MSNMVNDLLDGNSSFIEGEFLPNENSDHAIAAKQRPKVLWIGCSDSRVSEHQMTGSKPGTMFVHRHGCQGGGQPDRQGEEALAG
jgi:carbonic anhydrase